MRKKLQDVMFEMSYIFELIISVIVGISILIFGAKLVIEIFNLTAAEGGVAPLVDVIDDALTLAIGAELIKMLCKHTPETVIEVLAFALARHLVVCHVNPLENFITVVAIAILFAVRKFLLIKKHDMVETPDGLIETDAENVIHSDD